MLFMVLTHGLRGIQVLVTKRPHVAINCVVYTILIGSPSLQVLSRPDAASGVLCRAFLAPWILEGAHGRLWSYPW